MIRLLILFLTLACLFPSQSFAKPLKACLNADTGKVRVKKRCRKKRNEAVLSAEILQGLGATQVGPQGETGPQGPEGPQGAQGLPGIANVTLDFSSGLNENIPASSTITLYSNPCPTGSTLISGGCSSNNMNITLVSSHTSNLTDWQCIWKNNSASAQFAILRAKTICAEVNG